MNHGLGNAPLIDADHGRSARLSFNGHDPEILDRREHKRFGSPHVIVHDFVRLVPHHFHVRARQ